MEHDAASYCSPPEAHNSSAAELPDADVLARGREILRIEAAAVLGAADAIDASFARAVRLLEHCTGSVVVTGIGKAGLVARKVSATLASTGTPSHFLHPAEAVHGDLGSLRRDDVLLALSQSGETEEVTRLLPHVAALGIRIVAITARADSTLGRRADAVVATGGVREACTLGLAPSTSTSVMLALGDALALVVSGSRGFTHADFAARHPGGSLGRQLMLVEDAMRPLGACRVARPEETVRAVFARPMPARRTGAVMIVGDRGELAGMFTDSDLARLFERRQDASLDEPIGRVMTCRPATIPVGTRLGDAVSIMEARRFSELPVVDAAGQLAGLLDVVDLVRLLPADAVDRPRMAGGSAAA